jgi:hypothetical protein
MFGLVRRFKLALIFLLPGRVAVSEGFQVLPLSGFPSWCASIPRGDSKSARVVDET